MKVEKLTDKELMVARFESESAIVVMPYTLAKVAERACELAARRAGVGDALLLAVEDQSRSGFLQVVNVAFERSKSPWFGYMTQDAYAGRSWLSIAMQTLESTNASLLAFNDGKWGGVLAAFGLVRRTWGQRNYGGPLFFKDYLRHYAEAELTLLAMQDRQFTYNANSVLTEVRWQGEDVPIHPRDKALFAQRKTSGFDGRVSDPKFLGLFC